MLNESGERRKSGVDAFPAIRYVPEADLLYLTSFSGIDLHDPKTGEIISHLKTSKPDGQSATVEVKDNTIYALTFRGKVFALRHPEVAR